MGDRVSTPNANLIPQHMRSGVILYVCAGVEPGGFWKAVLRNDLVDAVCRADEENRELLPHYADLLYNALPRPCWGSHEDMCRWVQERREKAFPIDGVDWPSEWAADIEEARKLTTARDPERGL